MGVSCQAVIISLCVHGLTPPLVLYRTLLPFPGAADTRLPPTLQPGTPQLPPPRPSPHLQLPTSAEQDASVQEKAHEL